MSETPVIDDREPWDRPGLLVFPSGASAFTTLQRALRQGSPYELETRIAFPGTVAIVPPDQQVSRCLVTNARDRNESVIQGANTGTFVLIGPLDERFSRHDKDTLSEVVRRIADNGELVSRLSNNLADELRVQMMIASPRKARDAPLSNERVSFVVFKPGRIDLSEPSEQDDSRNTSRRAPSVSDKTAWRDIPVHVSSIFSIETPTADPIELGLPDARLQAIFPCTDDPPTGQADRTGESLLTALRQSNDEFAGEDDEDDLNCTLRATCSVEARDSRFGQYMPNLGQGRPATLQVDASVTPLPSDQPTTRKEMQQLRTALVVDDDVHRILARCLTNESGYAFDPSQRFVGLEMSHIDDLASGCFGTGRWSGDTELTLHNDFSGRKLTVRAILTVECLLSREEQPSHAGEMAGGSGP